MLKIIDGRRYDTSTARLIRQNGNHNEDKDLRWTETLYRSKTGIWFLYFEGGKKTVYAVSGIRPISEEAAVTWLTENFDKNTAQDVLLNIAGKPTPVTIQIPQALLKKIESRRKITGQSKTDVVLDALTSYFK